MVFSFTATEIQRNRTTEIIKSSFSPILIINLVHKDSNQKAKTVSSQKELSKKPKKENLY